MTDISEALKPQLPPGPEAQAAADRQLLMTYLADRDAACPACKYNLRQLKGNTCPECGIQLMLTVGATDGLGKSWITALIASIVPAAVGLPFQIMLMIAIGYGESVMDIADEPEGLIALLLVLYSVCCIPVAIALLSGRRRFMRWAIEVQQRIAIGLSLAALFAGFVAFILIASAF